ncbi:hypothetical protein TanjilG_26274 [Lupinus angustifolius]|uniref:Uncharacterized protein n=1 Tax=Lupinus angustifolius TaxID=3871 RepID=A0A4P1R2I4_LUPAN|nr:PREDICTED: uncharacterized protein LOC109362300 [Lupinus angustifolius]OIV99936.1 hypothetical protein TanjilG_26274 [Lupinus angustifolius]
MAVTFTPITAAIKASATAGNLTPDPHRRRNSSANWWTPLFSWSPEPDYIDNNSKSSESDPSVTVSKPSRTRFTGGFTEEKAKQLRLMSTKPFHDRMYHSAIASRLASDFNARSDQ